MNCKVVAVFRDRDSAQRARAELIGSGCLPEEIDLHEQSRTREGDKSLWEKIKDFFTPEEVGVYREAGRRGGVLLAVHTQESRAQKIEDLLRRLNPINLEGCMGDWRKEGWQGGLEAGRSEQTIPVTEEQLNVGKKTVDTGGVRIHKRVEETPVEETIPLREERVTGTVEVRASREEARVGDQVQKTLVDVEENLDDYREDFNQHYATSGGKFEEYLPAYSFGRKAAMDERYQGRDWVAIEPEIEREYLGLFPDQWSHHREAIRYGYDRAFAESGREAH